MQISCITGFSETCRPNQLIYRPNSSSCFYSLAQCDIPEENFVQNITRLQIINHYTAGHVAKQLHYADVTTNTALCWLCKELDIQAAGPVSRFYNCSFKEEKKNVFHPKCQKYIECQFSIRWWNSAYPTGRKATHQKAKCHSTKH